MKTCKDCESPLVIKQTKKSAAQLKKPYYYSAYYYCNTCQKLYHDDEFKVINHQTDSFLDDAPSEKHISSQTSSKNDVVEIWTDGACTRNGTPQAKAAWAFVTGPAHGNIERGALVDGKQTNNVAEGQAIQFALEWAAYEGYTKIKLHTDSQISLFNLNKRPEKVKVNAEIFFAIDRIVRENNLQVEYIKVLGHSGDVNNDRADRVANGLATQ